MFRIPDPRVLAMTFLGLAAMGTGCASGPGGGNAATSPRATLGALQQAAGRGDAAALYALLPDRARREESFESFRQRIQVEQPELRELSEALRQQDQHHIAPQLQLALRSGATVAIEDEPEGWRLAESGFGSASAPTPAAAARALRQALLRQSLPALLAILSATARGSLRAEMQAIIDALEDPSALESTVTSNTGQRVELRLPDGHTLRMVREGTNWRVDDLQ